jgi:hypothetical protein
MLQLNLLALLVTVSFIIFHLHLSWTVFGVFRFLQKMRQNISVICVQDKARHETRAKKTQVCRLLVCRTCALASFDWIAAWSAYVEAP